MGSNHNFSDDINRGCTVAAASQKQKHTLLNVFTVLFHCIMAHNVKNKIPQTPEICVNDIFSE